MVANCGHLKKLKFFPVLPYAFTEHGAVMLASVLNSPVAIEASIQVLRAHAYCLPLSAFPGGLSDD